MLLSFNRILIFYLICVSSLLHQISEGSNSVTSTNGKWTSVHGSSYFGVNTPQIYWGIPIDEDTGLNGMSSYLYEAITYPVGIPIGESFKIGEFTHINRSIYGNSISEANLQINLGLNIGDTAVNNITFNTRFIHEETSNNSGGGGCCDDLVGLVLDETSKFEFTVDSVSYNLELLGFYINDTLVNSFITSENSEGVADFLAIITAKNLPQPPIDPPIGPPIDPPIGPPVDPPGVINPEPETYLILGGALLFILLKKGKKRCKNQKTRLAFLERQSPTFFLGRFWKR